MNRVHDKNMDANAVGNIPSNRQEKSLGLLRNVQCRETEYSVTINEYLVIVLNLNR